MRPNTINKAIAAVLTEAKKPLSAKEIFARIVALDLYKFKAANPYHVVLTQLRRHCVGLDFPTAQKEKHFVLTQDGLYNLAVNGSTKSHPDPGGAVANLKDTHARVVSEFKTNVLNQLKAIAPEEFEIFSKKLLEVYGFTDVCVTKRSRDGGIDGYGKLRVGISSLNVAFQCKRWKTNKVSRPDVDKFRGATQGEFEQAIFFTTSDFSKDALSATIRKGAIPIILIDGNSIVELMIEKRFGVDVENLPIYISALDDILF